MSKYKIEIKWALLYVAMVWVWTLGERLIGLHDTYVGLQSNIALLLMIPTFALYFFENYDKKKTYYGGKMSYVQGFTTGLRFTVGMIILTPLIQWVSTSVISPHFFQNMIDYDVRINETPVDVARSKFNYSYYVIGNVLFDKVVVGTVFSAFSPIWTRTI